MNVFKGEIPPDDIDDDAIDEDINEDNKETPS